MEACNPHALMATPAKVSHMIRKAGNRFSSLNLEHAWASTTQHAQVSTSDGLVIKLGVGRVHQQDMAP